jgi:hypothetical protein
METNLEIDLLKRAAVESFSLSEPNEVHAARQLRNMGLLHVLVRPTASLPNAPANAMVMFPTTRGLQRLRELGFDTTNAVV